MGPTDHKVVEQFLGRGSSRATSAVTLDAKAFRHQEGAAEAAKEAGSNVFYETATERLASPGYGLEKYPMFVAQPYLIDRLASSLTDRAELVERVLHVHPDYVTHATAPHFYVDSERVARLNVDLAEMTRLQTTLPVRAVLTVANRFAHRYADQLAAEYVRAGVLDLELRLSPFGGDDESVKKIRDGFAAAQKFTDAGLTVTLGQSGNLGQVAVALGHVNSYSVGVGMLERVDHSSVVNRQKQPPRERAEDDAGGGPTAGIYLQGISSTLPRKYVERLLNHTDLRTRVGCRIGKCATSVQGPLLDRRDHYLHARDAEMDTLQRHPAGWRPTSETQRLQQVLALRQRINDHYLDRDMAKLKVRTIESLITDIDQARQAS